MGMSRFSPLLSNHGRKDSSSSVTSAEMNGRLSPSTKAWETKFATLDNLFDRTGRDILAACGDDEILLTSDDIQEAVIVDTSQIAGTDTSRLQ